MTGETRQRVPETKLTEFEVDTETVALISDVSNERAWIQSNKTVPIES